MRLGGEGINEGGRISRGPTEKKGTLINKEERKIY